MAGSAFHSSKPSQYKDCSYSIQYKLFKDCIFQYTGMQSILQLLDFVGRRTLSNVPYTSPECIDPFFRCGSRFHSVALIHSDTIY